MRLAFFSESLLLFFIMRGFADEPQSHAEFLREMREFPSHPGLVNQFLRKLSGLKEFDSGASGMHGDGVPFAKSSPREPLGSCGTQDGLEFSFVLVGERCLQDPAACSLQLGIERQVDRSVLGRHATYDLFLNIFS